VSYLARITECEHGNSGMHDYTERSLFPGCSGGTTTKVEVDHEVAERGTRHWVEDIEGDNWEDMPPQRRMGLMQVVDGILRAALGMEDE
jgi:hypothetical protein